MFNRDVRPAAHEDASLLRAWVNADDSMKWKKDTKNLISIDEHLAWFHARLNDPSTQIWIILHDGKPSGQVRLEKIDDFVYVDIYVVAVSRGIGLAGFALNESINRYTQQTGKEKFCAIVNPNNHASEKLFLENGFHKENGELDDWLKFIRVVG